MINLGKRHIIEIDVGKALGAVAVVLIHVSAYAMQNIKTFNSTYKVALILNQLSRFSVPIFVLLSGVGLGLSYKKNMGYLKFLKKRLGKLIPAYIFWGLIYLIIVNKNYNYALWPELFIKGDKIFYHLYFMPMIIKLYLIFPILYIASLQDKIEQCNIKTDVDGKVVKNNAKENQYPKAGDSIIIDDTSKYKLSLDVSQYDAVNIKKGQKAAIKIKGIDKIYSGVVTDIGNIAQAKINTTGGDQEFKVNVKVTFDNADALIKAGYEGSADIVLNEKPSSIAIGFDGVKEDRAAKKKYVYVVDGNKVSKKYIKTGLESEYDVEVLEGLEEGEIYVINPPEKLKEGDLVSLKK